MNVIFVYYMCLVLHNKKILDYMYHICIKCMFWMIRISPKPFENSGLLKEKKNKQLVFFFYT